MKYRDYGQAGQALSVLALDLDCIAHRDDVTGFLRESIDAGVDYLDLGKVRNPEERDRNHRITAAALLNGYRSRVRLALHLPALLITKTLDIRGFLSTELQKLKTDYIDFLILDDLNRETWPIIQGSGVLEKIEAARVDAKILATGFAFRDQHQVLRDILNDYQKWSLVQFDYSFMDADHYPGLGGLRLAHALGMAVIVSKPLKRKRLERPPAGSNPDHWATLLEPYSMAEWGMRWILNHPEVTSVFSDSSTSKQFELNLKIAETTTPGSLAIRELLLINQLRDAYRKLKPIPCNTCRVCMPCPQDIDVPRILELYNDAMVYHDAATAREIYQEELHQLDDCNQCGACARHCGRMIKILDWLEEARRIFED